MSRNYYRKSKRHQHYRPKKSEPRYICPLCNRPLNVTMTAIVHKETGKKAHFDCILKELKKSCQLSPKEELFYLGGGSFGIIERAKGKNSMGFVIKKRFQYESRET